MQREMAENDEGSEGLQAKLSRLFPVFCYQFLGKKYGLRKLVDQTAWEFLCSIEALRASHLDIELFSSFLCEQWSLDDFIFFLYARDMTLVAAGIRAKRDRLKMVPQKEKTRGANNATLTWQQAHTLARTLFSEHPEWIAPFMQLLETYFTHTTPRVINAMQFLSIALAHYHDISPPTAEMENDLMVEVRAQAAEREQMMRQAELQVCAYQKSVVVFFLSFLNDV